MKRIVSLLTLLLFVLSFSSPALAASVPVQTFPGNDLTDYTPPNGYIYYQIPDSGAEGVHTIAFDYGGTINLEGPYLFTVTIGSLPSNNYTQVLSWVSNFPICAVIVSGDSAFNLYQYDPGFRTDTDLLSPDNASGDPGNVSRVSLVINPDVFQTEQAIITLTGFQTSLLIVNTILQIISTILLGLLTFFMFLLLFGSRFNIFGSCIRRFHRKPHKPNKPPCPDKDMDCDKPKDKDCDKGKDHNCHKKEDNDCHDKDKNDFCSKIYDSSSGYSLDCNYRDTFPYHNNYNNIYK